MLTIQIVGVLIGLLAIQLTMVYYKRAHFSRREFAFWLTIWLAFIFVALFPRSVKPILGALGLQRSMDLIMIVAFIVLFVLAFHNYTVTRRQGEKLEKLVQTLALRDLDRSDQPPRETRR